MLASDEKTKKVIKQLLDVFVDNSVGQLYNTSVHQQANKDFYSILFEELVFSSDPAKKIYIGFGLDTEMQKTILGSWFKDPEESNYHFWLRVCKDIKGSGVESIKLKDNNNFYWLTEAMSRVF